MAPKAQQIAKLVDMLPEQDQDLAYELVKKLVLAWDPDFTRVTDEEAAHMEAAEASGFVSADEIDWNNLDRYAG